MAEPFMVLPDKVSVRFLLQKGWRKTAHSREQMEKGSEDV